MSPYTHTHMYIYVQTYVYLIFTSKYLYYVTLNSSVLLFFLRYSKIVLYPHLLSPHPFFWSFQWTIGKNKDSILYGIVKVGFLGENTWQKIDILRSPFEQGFYRKNHWTDWYITFFGSWSVLSEAFIFLRVLQRRRAVYGFIFS